MIHKEISAQRARRTKKRKTKKKFKFFKFLSIFVLVFCFFHFNIGNLLDLFLNDTEASATTGLNSTFDDPYKDVPLHNYNWDNLSITSDRIDYTDNKGYKAVQGVDVSRYQGDINWTKVKSSGISFAMLRLGYRGYTNGEVYIDEKFNRNIQQALTADVKIGTYFFSQAITEEEAIEEAKFVLENISGYDVSFPIVFDLEEISATDHRTHNLTRQERTSIATAFCEHIQAAGYTPMIYGNVSWLTHCYDLTQIIKYDLWLAQYTNCPSFPYDFQMWQYTNSGYVDGIDHIVDINLCFVPY